MKAEVVNFKVDDGVKLDGLIYNYSDIKDSIIISTHGMGSNCFRNRDKEIAKLIENTNISLLTYNNRGAGILTNIKKETNNEITTIILGCANENIYECYYDIKGAIEFVISLGYTKIFLQGHSLGSTKTIYTYNNLKSENYDKLDYIKGVIILSLLDIPQGIIDLFQYKDEDTKKLIDYALKLEKEGNGNIFMPEGTFLQPVSASEFIRLCIKNDEINFAKYHDLNYNYKEINNINVPLFMRWGNKGELISQDSKELVSMLKNRIHNKNLNIDYIDGANHMFEGYEDVLAKQIINFITHL